MEVSTVTFPPECSSVLVFSFFSLIVRCRIKAKEKYFVCLKLAILTSFNTQSTAISLPHFWDILVIPKEHFELLPPFLRNEKKKPKTPNPEKKALFFWDES